MSNARKVHYKSIQRSSKATNNSGVYLVTQKWADGKIDELGKAYGSRKAGHFTVATIDGNNVTDTFPTLAKAGEGLRKIWDKANKSNDNAVEAAQSAEELLTLEEAAQKLCANASNPLAALKKRISRGSVMTRETDNGVMVVIPNEAEAA